MTGFAEWSRRAGTNSVIWSMPERPPATISIMLAPLSFTRYPVDITAGEPQADIGLYHARVQVPDPFDAHGLTTACRDFLVDTVEQAVDRDKRLRWIRWADDSLTSCNPINGRRRPRRAKAGEVRSR